jgi:uncharacterized protein YdeI (YjbR/CyaY-like superfamily)
MTAINDYERVAAATSAEWRSWLAANHVTSPGVWLVFFKKGSGIASIEWGEAVAEALCFGWIDSKVQSIDDERYEQYFTQRKPTSPWSKLNKEKIAELVADDRLAEAGYRTIEVAKENGSWSILDDAEALIVPDDLSAAFPDNEARKFFDEMPPSARRNTLAWIALAKRGDTRARRIAATAAAAAKRERPNGF